jgi:hypothetical protein
MPFIFFFKIWKAGENPHAEVLIGKPMIAYLAIKFLFMDAEGSLPRSEEPAATAVHTLERMHPIHILPPQYFKKHSFHITFPPSLRVSPGLLPS